MDVAVALDVRVVGDVNTAAVVIRSDKHKRVNDIVQKKKGLKVNRGAQLDEEMNSVGSILRDGYAAQLVGNEQNLELEQNEMKNEK